MYALLGVKQEIEFAGTRRGSRMVSFGPRDATCWQREQW